MRLGLLLLIAVLAWSEVPQCDLAPGWQQSGARRTYEGESLYEYMNGNSEGYLIYSFRKMTGVSCTKSGVTIVVDVSDMGDPEGAFGIFSANRDVKSPIEKIGMAAQILPRKAIAARGQYYLEIAAEPEGDYTVLLRELIQTLTNQVAGQTTPPDALQWFPTAGLQPGYPRLIPQSVLGIRALTRGYVAYYENGSKAFVLPAKSAEAAGAMLEKVKARLADATSVTAGDGGFAGTDKYLGTMVIFRKDHYVAGYATVPSGIDVTAVAKSLVAQIR